MAVKRGPCLLTEERIRAFETKCMRKLLPISYLEQKTNDWVRSTINFLVGPQEPVLTTVKRQKLAGFRHVTHHDILSKTILQGTLKGGRRRGRQRKCWMDNIKEWASLPMPELLIGASCRKDWKRISAESSLVSPLWLPIGQRTEKHWTEFYSTSFPLILHMVLVGRMENEEFEVPVGKKKNLW